MFGFLICGKLELLFVADKLFGCTEKLGVFVYSFIFMVFSTGSARATNGATFAKFIYQTTLRALGIMSLVNATKIMLPRGWLL